MSTTLTARKRKTLAAESIETAAVLLETAIHMLAEAGPAELVARLGEQSKELKQSARQLREEA